MNLLGVCVIVSAILAAAPAFATLSGPPDIRLSAVKSIRLDAGGVLRVKAGESDSGPQCLVANRGNDRLTLSRGSDLMMLSLPGSSNPDGTLHDWEMHSLRGNLLIHCEFPEGVPSEVASSEARRILASHFRLPESEADRMPTQLAEIVKVSVSE